MARDAITTVASNRENARSRAADGGPARSAGRAGVLVTDDRPEMLEVIDRALGDHFECEFAGSVDEARDKLGEGRFQMAICDVNAAGELALALAEEILLSHVGTAVVLVTGEDDAAVADRAFALGVHGYLVEPFWPAQLLITVMSGLRRRDLEVATIARARNLAEQFQTIIDMAPIPIYAKDDAHRYLVANAKADELAGLSRGEAIGKTDKDLMDPAGAERAWVADNRILEGDPALELDQEISIGGVERTFHTVKFPLLDEDGGIAAVAGISVDTTPQQEALRLRDELSSSQRESVEELRLSREETIERLVRAVERHDAPTGSHVIRIGELAARLGEDLGLAPKQVELLRLAAPMHDIGKIGTPEDILQEPGPLDPAQRREMQRHPLVGHEILTDSKSELLQMAAAIALTHHERWDGTGYPHGLAGEEIPIEGRITAVADVFDALLSDRSYRPALPLDEATALMAEGRGTQFDPKVLDALLADLDGYVAARR